MHLHRLVQRHAFAQQAATRDHVRIGQAFAKHLQPHLQHAEQGTQSGLRFQGLQIVAARDEMPVLPRREEGPDDESLALVS
ncbi:MAG: hypothetical protein ACO1QR_06060, partial [Chthoniobacteraceae bacterium]